MRFKRSKARGREMSQRTPLLICDCQLSKTKLRKREAETFSLSLEPARTSEYLYVLRPSNDDTTLQLTTNNGTQVS